MWKGSASKSLQRMQNSLLGRSAPTLLKRPSVLRARSVIYHPLYLPSISPLSPLYLPSISPLSPQVLLAAERAAAEEKPPAPEKPPPEKPPPPEKLPPRGWSA